MDYNNQLRHGILDAYSGIIQGMGPQKCAQYLRTEVPDVVQFVSSIGAEATGNIEPDEDVAKASVNLLGDICSCMPDMSSALKLAPQKQWETLVSYCEQNENLQAETEWAVQQIRQ
jgi:importin subunit beta-1